MLADTLLDKNVRQGDRIKKIEKLTADTNFSATEYAAGIVGKAPEAINCYTCYSDCVTGKFISLFLRMIGKGLIF